MTHWANHFDTSGDCDGNSAALTSVIFLLLRKLFVALLKASECFVRIFWSLAIRVILSEFVISSLFTYILFLSPASQFLLAQCSIYRLDLIDWEWVKTCCCVLQISMFFHHQCDNFLLFFNDLFIFCSAKSATVKIAKEKNKCKSQNTSWRLDFSSHASHLSIEMIIKHEHHVISVTVPFNETVNYEISPLSNRRVVMKIIKIITTQIIPTKNIFPKVQ